MRTCILRAFEIDADIAAPPALEEMDVRIVRQRLRDQFVGRPIGRDRGADELGRHDRRCRIVEIELQIVGEERMDVAARRPPDWTLCVSWMRLSSRARLAG